ncbi:MAG: YlbF family regulator, partial [Clostridia bacterium]|nr:YlbF family regulator [Clostridia bacterium]
MNVLEAVRNLGEAIQQDERFIRYAKAKLANDTNEDLQKAIGDFNIVRMELDREMTSENQDDD